MLRYWTHPKSGQPRLYVSKDIISKALDDCDLAYEPDRVKVYYLPTSPRSPAQIKAFIEQEAPVPKQHISELKQAVRQAIEGSGPDALTWDDLEKNAKAGQTEGTSSVTGDKQKAENAKPDVARIIEAKKLKTPTIPLPKDVVIEVSQRETELMATLLDAHPQIQVKRTDNSMADLRLVTDEGIELLINRIRLSKADDGTETLSDLLADKRLFLDIEKIQFRAQVSDHPVIPVVILEGNPDLEKLKLAQIDGVEAFLIAAQRLSVIQTFSIDHSVHLIVKLAEQTLNQAQGVQRHHKKPTTLIDQQAYLIQSLPGVSDIMAEALIRQLGGVQNVLTATEPDLAKVKGIGGKKAREIAKVLGTQLFD